MKLLSLVRANIKPLFLSGLIPNIGPRFQFASLQIYGFYKLYDLDCMLPFCGWCANVAVAADSDLHLHRWGDHEACLPQLLGPLW